MDAVVGIAEDALAVEDPWEWLRQFMQRDFELQSSDRGLREFMLGHAESAEWRRRSGERIHPLVAQLVERAHASGALRDDIGQGDIEIVLGMLGSLMDASLQVDPDLWRRYLAMILAGMRQGERREAIPGRPPDQGGMERIMAGWIPPRRGRG